MEQVPNGNERIGRLEVAVTDLSARVGRIEIVLDRLQATVTDLQVRVARLEDKVERLAQEFYDFKAEMKAEIKDLRKQVDFNFRLLAAMNITTTLGLAALMAKGFGWL